MEKTTERKPDSGRAGDSSSFLSLFSRQSIRSTGRINITLPESELLSVSWSAPDGGFVLPGETVVSGRFGPGGTGDGDRNGEGNQTSNWCFRVPVSAIVRILVPDGRFPPRTVLGYLEYGPALEQVVAKRRDEERDELLRLKEEKAREEGRCRALNALLRSRAQKNTALWRELKAVRDRNQRMKELLRSLREGDATASVPAFSAVRKLLVRLHATDSVPPDFVPALLLLFGMVETVFPEPGTAPDVLSPREILDRETRLVNRLYDWIVSSVDSAAAPLGLPGEVAEEKRELLQQLREMHLEHLRQFETPDVFHPKSIETGAAQPTPTGTTNP